MGKEKRGDVGGPTTLLFYSRNRAATDAGEFNTKEFADAMRSAGDAAAAAAGRLDPVAFTSTLDEMAKSFKMR